MSVAYRACCSNNKILANSYLDQLIDKYGFSTYSNFGIPMIHSQFNAKHGGIIRTCARKTIYIYV